MFRAGNGVISKHRVVWQALKDCLAAIEGVVPSQRLVNAETCKLGYSPSNLLIINVCTDFEGSFLIFFVWKYFSF